MTSVPTPDRRTASPATRVAPWVVSLGVHGGLLLALFLLAPAPAPRTAAQPLAIRLSGVDTPAPAMADEVAEREAEPRDEMALPDLPVELPPAIVEDTLPDPDAPRALLPPVEIPEIDLRLVRPRPAPPKPEVRPQVEQAPRAPARRSAPRVLRRPDLAGFYPEAARRLGLEGTALVLVVVDGRGRVVRAVLREGSGHDVLDAAALSVARNHAFVPGTAGRALLPVNFRLRD